MRTCIVIFALVLSPAAWAQQEKKAPEVKKEAPEVKKEAPEVKKEAPKTAEVPSGPAPELAKLGFLVANWSCNGAGKSADGEVTFKSSWKNKWDLKKHWLSVTYEAKKSKTMPNPVKGIGWIGWDGGNKRYLFFGVNDGGGHFLLASSGATDEGKVMVFEGLSHAYGGAVPLRFTYTKTGDRTLTVGLEIKAGEKWMKVQEDTCKR